MKTILITGANGFVGSNLYDALSSDFHLIGLDITGPGKYPPGDLFGWDDLAKLPPLDAIIHLAGKAHDTANTAREEEYTEVNVGLTKTIFDYFLQSGTEKFIFFSSVKAVADTVQGDVLTEEAIPDPKTPYGKSKLEAEEYIQQSTVNSQQSAVSSQQSTVSSQQSAVNSQQPPASRLPLPAKQIYILRPAMIHGPGNKGNLNLLYRVVKSGIPWPLGAFDNRRSFATIGNVSFVIRQLLEKPIHPGTYQVADDEPVSTNELIRLMARTLNRKPRILRLPSGLIRALARTGDILHLPLNSERLKKLTETYVVSNAKLKEALGIETMPVQALQGLETTLRGRSSLHERLPK
ncbi:MAG: NAD-dependent epimerase/dehydratase family protein [Bacteroidales bacterium]|nr:NAD-dependent epimerase/dehydratase family protein [Bacteroidales bacterium]